MDVALFENSNISRANNVQVSIYYFNLLKSNGELKHACNNTKDKIFLLSYSDVLNTNYFADATARLAIGTDYAKIQNLSVSIYTSSKGYSRWWLRSPYSDYSNYANCVNYNGNLGSYVVYVSYNGVRLVCWINI